MTLPPIASNLAYMSVWGIDVIVETNKDLLTLKCIIDTILIASEILLVLKVCLCQDKQDMRKVRYLG